MINTSASERTRQIRLLRGLATDSEKLGSYKSVYNPGLTLAALPKFFTKLDAGTRRASTAPAPAPTISNFVIQGLYGGSPTFFPGGHVVASLEANIANATTASYVVYLVSSPSTVVTNTQLLLSSGSNNVGAGPIQSITIDPLASSPNLNILTNTREASASGPYIVTLTATGPGGSVSQSINNVPIYFP